MHRLFKGRDGKQRCSWCSATEAYELYHDTEWGFPVDNDFRLFEKISLEGFQSGLSWRTILDKRENFREAFKQFDFYQVAKFTQRDINRLLKNEGIVRHQGKISATINNAERAIELVDEAGSLANFFWQYEPKKKSAAPEIISVTEESTALSKALKKRGWKFVGPTTAYAFMQAMGLVNDHAKGCSIRTQVNKARQLFTKPIPPPF